MLLIWVLRFQVQAPWSQRGGSPSTGNVYESRPWISLGDLGAYHYMRFASIRHKVFFPWPHWSARSPPATRGHKRTALSLVSRCATQLVCAGGENRPRDT